MGLIAYKNNDAYFKKTGKKIVYSFRMDEKVYELIKNIADAERRSINTQLEIFVEDAIINYIENTETTEG